MEHFNSQLICFDSLLFRCTATLLKPLAPMCSLKVVFESIEKLESYDHLV